MSIERAVTLLSPAFAAVSGAIVAWFAKNFPGGPQLDPTQLAGLFALGATAGSAALLKWLHGRQKFVQLETDTDKVADRLGVVVRANAPASVALSDFERILQAHSDQVVAKVGGLIGAPPSVEQVASEILKRAGSSTPVGSPPASTANPASVPVPPPTAA